MWRADLMLWKLNNIFYGSICEINSDYMYGIHMVDMYDIALKVPSKMKLFQKWIEEIKKLLCRKMSQGLSPCEMRSQHKW